MDKRILVIKENLKTLTRYLQILSLVIIVLSVHTQVLASDRKAPPKIEDIQNQIIDLEPTEIDIPKSLKDQLSRQSKIVMIKNTKRSGNYSNGKAEIEIIQPERKRKSYVNFTPSNMCFTAQTIDLNNDSKSELTVTYNGFVASAINWPLWIFSVKNGNFFPILKATVGTTGYNALRSTSCGYHDIITTKTILDNPDQAPKNEFTIYKFDGTKYVINSKLIELSSRNPNRQ